MNITHRTTAMRGWGFASSAALVIGGALALGAGPAAAADAAQSADIKWEAVNASQSVTVPDGVIGMQFVAVGGGGGNGQGGDKNGTGGRGAIVTGTVSVTPGAVVTADVGGQGQHWNSDRPAPSNGGGWGGSAPGGDGGVATDALGEQYGGGGGGGATTLHVGSDLVAIAGGGGGGGTGGTLGWDGGNGGDAGAKAADGWRGHCPQYGDGGHGGQGPAQAGDSGGTEKGQQPAGGGGGGLLGGQGGHSNVDCGGGGGAGSSMFDPALVRGASITTAADPASGSLTISWTYGADGGGEQVEPPPGSVVLGSTGAPQDLTVPDGVTAIGFMVIGGGGGNGTMAGGVGGKGAVVSGTVPVTPGTQLVAEVGGQGLHFSTAGGLNSNDGGWGGSAGGGQGGIADNGAMGAGGGGGGASALTVGGQVVALAGGGGGGGSGPDDKTGSGGKGGDAGLVAQDGYHGACASYGDGGHAGLAPTGAGAIGGIGGDTTGGGGGGGGLLGGEGGHGGLSCGGGGGAGTSMYDPDVVIGGQIETWNAQSTGWISISWVLGARLDVSASATDVEAGGSIELTARLLAADGSVIGTVPHIGIASDSASDVISSATVQLGTAGSRTLTVTVPGSNLSTTLSIRVRTSEDTPAAPAPSPSSAATDASTGGAVAAPAQRTTRLSSTGGTSPAWVWGVGAALCGAGAGIMLVGRRRHTKRRS